MCDTFVALGNSTKNGNVIFGKNSDRPYNEAQLIVYKPHLTYSTEEQLNCTYILVPQASETAAVLLSQPYWMWGAEMGANEYGVAIGNEAVHSKEPLRSTGLLGMDLLRLGLERGKTAIDALNSITELLSKYGQGGGCSVDDPGWMYHNSFLIADPQEAYILECADMWWVAEKVKNVRSISNSLSIRGRGDLKREGIIQHAIEQGYCKDDNDFDFASTFTGEYMPESYSPYSRPGKSMQLLTENKGKISSALMMDFLREHEVGICMHGYFESTGSQVSEISSTLNRSVHWFTGSTRPCISIFKPYAFPADNFTVQKSGPYKRVDNSWFWSRHASLKKANSKKISEIELELTNEADDIITNENDLSDGDFLDKVKAIHAKSWQKSEEMIR